MQAKARGVGIHTHASENKGEIAAVEARYGKRNLLALHDLGLSGPHVCVAHCVHLSDGEIANLAGPAEWASDDAKRLVRWALR